MLFQSVYIMACDKVVSQPFRSGRAPVKEIYFLLLGGQKRVRALPAFAVSWVILVENNQ